MPRHSVRLPSPDPRLNRPHPDALPTHRQCPDCPPGLVLPLNAENFHEDRSRYRWNLSRFSLRCKAHHNARTAQKAKENRSERSKRERARRQIDKLNRVQAAVFFTPQQVAIRLAKQEATRERRERIALFKRQNVRRQGGYDPAKDGIKLLIKERMREVVRRRVAVSAAARALRAREDE